MLTCCEGKNVLRARKENSMNKQSQESGEWTNDKNLFIAASRDQNMSPVR
jgi:hypothetical protein